MEYACLLQFVVACLDTKTSQCLQTLPPCIRLTQQLCVHPWRLQLQRWNQGKDASACSKAASAHLELYAVCAGCGSGVPSGAALTASRDPSLCAVQRGAAGHTPLHPGPLSLVLLLSVLLALLPREARPQTFLV